MLCLERKHGLSIMHLIIQNHTSFLISFVYTDTPTNSSSGVSSMHSISELTITMENSPTTSLTSRGSGFRSRSSTLGITYSPISFTNRTGLAYPISTCSTRVGLTSLLCTMHTPLWEKIGLG